MNNNTTINLKDNFYLSVNGIPRSAKKLLVTFLPYISEDDCKFYVNGKAEGPFKNYSNNGSTVDKAKTSFRTAIEKLVGKGHDPSKVKFTIYSLKE